MLGVFVTFFEKKVAPKNFLAESFWCTLCVRWLFCVSVAYLFVGRGLAPAEYSIYPRVILSEGRSPQSNPEGVCAAQDLRGGSRISVRDPDASHRAPRSTPLRSAQDDT